MNRPPVFTASGLSRRAALGRAAAVAAALSLGHRLSARAAAQEATPPPDPERVVGELLGVGQPTSTPGMELILRRTTIAPGGGLPPHSHPGSLLLVVDAGTWGYTALGGTIQLTRAAVGSTATPSEALPIGTEVLLTAGDWLFVEDPQDDIRNAGEEDVVLLIAGLTPVGEPFTTFMENMEGTPAS